MAVFGTILKKIVVTTASSRAFLGLQHCLHDSWDVRLSETSWGWLGGVASGPFRQGLAGGTVCTTAT